MGCRVDCNHASQLDPDHPLQLFSAQSQSAPQNSAFTAIFKSPVRISTLLLSLITVEKSVSGQEQITLCNNKSWKLSFLFADWDNAAHGCLVCI